MDLENLKEQLDRMEDKLDAALVRNENRFTKLETQAGFVKWGLGVLGAVMAFMADKLWPILVKMP